MSKHHWLASALVAAALCLSGAAHGQPAKIAPGDTEKSAFQAFDKFARSWMSEMEQRERSNRGTPAIERRGNRTVATYTGYGPEWNVEVHATGDRSAPWVGVLNYQEQVYTCSDQTTRSCEVSRSTPVTEVFPYRNGSWKY